jgi:hypothetical protein
MYVYKQYQINSGIHNSLLREPTNNIQKDNSSMIKEIKLIEK